MTTEERQERARKWQEGQLGSAVISAANWRLSSLVQSVVLLGCVATIIVLVTQYRSPPPAMPEIFVINPATLTLWRGPPGSYTVQDLWVKVRIKEFVTWLRRRSDDAVIMGEDWAAARAMTIGEAQEAIQRYQAALHPSKPEYAQNPLRIKVEHVGVRRRTDRTYEAAWDETWTRKYGGQPKRLRVEGTVTIDLLPTKSPTGDAITLADLQHSAMAVYISHYDVSEQPMPGGS